MKYVLTLLALVFFTAGQLRAAHKFPSRTGNPDTALVNIYIDHISDINFHDQEYHIDFWLWITFHDTSFDFKDMLQVPFAKSTDINVVHSMRIPGTNKWKEELRVDCTMHQAWDISDYPFDKQELTLSLYTPAFSVDRLFFKPDPTDVHYPEKIEMDKGWRSMKKKQGLSVIETVLNTAFEKDGESTNSEVQFHMVLERESSVSLFFKLFIGMYVSFFVAFMAFFIHERHPEAAFGLPVGGLFAAIGNKYVLESILPQTPQFISVDWLHSITIFCILLVIVFSACTVYLNENKDTVRGWKKTLFTFISIYGHIILGWGYVVVNLAFLVYGIFFELLDHKFI